MRWERFILKYLCPDFYHTNICEINLKYLKKIGIRGIICDLDNTLLAWDNHEVRPELKEWILKAKRLGISICILSNSLQERVNRIAINLEVPAISKALKPRKKAFKLAINRLDLIPNKVAVVGDQLFTDIYGGNRLRLLTILVEPMAKKELISTQVIRLIEKKVKKYLKSKSLI